MKIVLCVPPPNAVDHPLLGVASLAGMLIAAGHEVAILDLNAQLRHRQLLPDRYQRKEGDGVWSDAVFRQAMWPHLAALLNEFLGAATSGIDVFGIHVSSAGRSLAEDIGNAVRTCIPACKVIAGGPDFFVSPEEIAAIAPFDAIFLGEAEVSLARWLDDGCPNGVFHAPLIELDNLPLPDYSRFPLHSYSRQGVLPVETARGCVNRCAFCDDARMWKRYRAKTPARLKRDLVHLKAAGATRLTFCDSVLNPTPERFKAFLKVMKEVGLPWDGMLQAQGLDHALARDMARSGCREVFLGIESFSLTFLSRINKQQVSANGAQSLEALASAGISVSMGFIVAGPPLQTRTEFEHDLNTLEKLARHLSSVAINPLCIPTGTPLWLQGESLGIKGLEGEQGWRFWHAGNGIEDIRLRLSWCRETVALLNTHGVSTGANYENFDQYANAQLRDAERYLP